MKIGKLARKRILSDVESLITRAVNRIVREKALVTEPKLTAELVMKISSAIHYILTTFVQKYEFEMHAIFCHQQPYVNYSHAGKHKKCELGDLLFVYDEADKIEGNSLLLQAKKATKIQFSKSDIDSTQLFLYTDWPQFKYCNQNLSNDTRCIDAKTVGTGAQYLVMFPPYDDSIQYRCVLPRDVISSSCLDKEILAENIVGLFEFNTGRLYERNPNSSDEWAKMIYDLLNIEKISNKTRLYSCSQNSFQYKLLDKKEFIVFNYMSGGETEILIPNNSIETESVSSDKPFVIFHIIATETEAKQ